MFWSEINIVGEYWDSTFRQDLRQRLYSKFERQDRGNKTLQDFPESKFSAGVLEQLTSVVSL